MNIIIENWELFTCIAVGLFGLLQLLMIRILIVITNNQKDIKDVSEVWFREIANNTLPKENLMRKVTEQVDYS